MGELRFLRTIDPQSRSIGAQLLTGFCGRCPKCAKGGLFVNGLSVRDQCPVCGLGLKAHDAGDGPAVGATFIVGAIALAVALWLEFTYQPDMWIHVAVAAPIIGIGSFLTLRPLKGMLIAMQYRFRSVEQEDENLGQM